MDEVTLEELFARVPAAAGLDEEVDALHEVEEERRRAEAEAAVRAWASWPRRTPRLWDPWSGEALEEHERDAAAEEAALDAALDEALQEQPEPVGRAHELQVLALLNDVLGAEPLPPEDGHPAARPRETGAAGS